MINNLVGKQHQQPAVSHHQITKSHPQPQLVTKPGHTKNKYSAQSENLQPAQKLIQTSQTQLKSV